MLLYPAVGNECKL